MTTARVKWLPAHVSSIEVLAGGVFIAADRQIFRVQDPGELRFIYGAACRLELFEHAGRACAAWQDNDDRVVGVEALDGSEVDLPLEAAEALAFGRRSGGAAIQWKSSATGEWLVVFDSQTGQLDVRSCALAAASADGACIFLRQLKDGNQLVCLDRQWQRLWTVTLDKRPRSPWVEFGPMFSEDVVVVMSGINDARNEADLLAYSKQDGALRWCQRFEREVQAQVIDDRVYVAAGARMLVLDAQSGRVLVDANSGLTAAGDTTLWSDGRHLFFLSYKDRAVRVFSGDGQTLLNAWELPGGVTLARPAAVTRVGDTAYIPLVPTLGAGAGAAGGMLMLALEKVDAPAALVLEELADVARLSRVEKSGALHVRLEECAVDDVMRLGELTVRRAIEAHGSYLYQTTPNRAFTGDVVVEVAPELEKANADALDLLVTHIDAWAEYRGVASGKGDSPVRARWRTFSAT